MAEIEAVLFDLDGTLRDSREAIYGSLEIMLADLGLPVPPREEIARNIHMGTQEFFRIYAPDHDFRDIDPHYLEVFRAIPMPYYEGAEATVAALHEAGLQLGVVSSGRFTEEALVETGLRRYFAAVVSGRDTPVRKPDPEPVRLALERMGIHANRAVMVGDLPADIEAGRAAGVAATIAVTHGLGTREELLRSRPDQIVDDFTHLIGAVATMSRREIPLLGRPPITLASPSSVEEAPPLAGEATIRHIGRQILQSIDELPLAQVPLVTEHLQAARDILSPLVEESQAPLASIAETVSTAQELFRTAAEQLQLCVNSLRQYLADIGFQDNGAS